MASVKPQLAEDDTERARRVYIIDDDSDVRKSLHFLLGSSAINAWPFAEATDFFDQLPDLDPAPVLLDIRMSEIDGLQVLALLKERDIRWPVIVMTAHGDVSIAVRAMKLGAIEFIEKPFAPEVLKQVLDQAFAILDQEQAGLHARDTARKLFDTLSRRESEVVALLMGGAANKIIANRLDLSVRTVELYRSNALAKLKVKSIAEVMALAAVAEIPLEASSRLDEAG